MKLEFLTSGLRTTTQDSGRPGFTHIGVPVGGALDQAALHYANRLVGNPIYSPVLEITLTGPRIKCLESGQVASAGGDFKLVVNGQARAPNTAITLEAGDELSFEPSSAGCRTFLAVAGNWCVKRWLGSASALRVGSHELLPEAVWYKGNVLETYAFNVTPWPSPLLPPPRARRSILAYRGPEYHLLDPTSIAELFGKSITVVDPSNRMALLTDARLNLTSEKSESEMVSSGVQPGTVQVTHDGQAIVLMRDGQTIGGYPRVLQCTVSSLDHLAQLRVGDAFAFVLIDA